MLFICSHHRPSLVYMTNPEIRQDRQPHYFLFMRRKNLIQYVMEPTLFSQVIPLEKQIRVPLIEPDDLNYSLYASFDLLFALISNTNDAIVFCKTSTHENFLHELHTRKAIYRNRFTQKTFIKL